MCGRGFLIIPTTPNLSLCADWPAIILQCTPHTLCKHTTPAYITHTHTHTHTYTHTHTHTHTHTPPHTTQPTHTHTHTPLHHQICSVHFGSYFRFSLSLSL